MLEAPVAIHPAIVIDEDGGVEAVDAIHLHGVVGIPVAHLKRTIRTVTLGDQTITEARLVVGEEIIGLLARAVGHQRHVRCIEHISRAGRVEGLALGILVDHEDDTIVAPLAQILHRSRPHHLIATTVGGNQVVVRTIDIYALLPGVVGIVEHVWLSIGDMFPEGQIGVADGQHLTLGCLNLLAAGNHQGAACCTDDHAQGLCFHFKSSVWFITGCKITKIIWN